MLHGDDCLDDDMMIFPITDIDHHDAEDEEEDSDQDDISGRYSGQKGGWKPAMSLRQRRRSKLGLDMHSEFNKLNYEKLAVHEEAPKQRITPPSAGKRKWLRALKKIDSIEDPWSEFHIEDLPVEKCRRHRYNALKKKWVQDEVIVKMEIESFNHGAMRACYRLKKRPTFTSRRDWSHAHNYVAKSYMEDVPRGVYFEDVRLQMDTKLWGEEYNRHNPPKKVDIFQMNIIEFIDRPGNPLYHLEHFIEGEYIKYNSNSGFVDDHLRLTPQAFSHFTFERSGHQLIVVDIQGVGDLWTDPQMHTFDGEGYGDGNLGTKGMALFFHSHACNSICQSLGLSKFDLSPTEVGSQLTFIKKQKGATTVCRGSVESVISASPSDKMDLTSFLARSRSRTLSTASSMFSDVSEDQSEEDMFSQSLPSEDGFRGRWSTDEPMSPETPDRICPTDLMYPRSRYGNRSRFVSESDDSAASTLTELIFFWYRVVERKEEEERNRFQELAALGHRPSCIQDLNGFNNNSLENTVLGQIHHDLAKYHDLGRFTDNLNDIDWEAALFHERHAADLGVMEAMLTLARLFLGMQPDILVNCTVQQSEDKHEEGLDLMQQAADSGDRFAMLFLAHAFQTGTNLAKSRTQSYKLAVEYYEKATSTEQNDQDGQFDCTMDTPIHTIKARLAEMYLKGGFGLGKDPSYAGDLYTEAAEEAMAATKGRLANEFYALAEEAYGEIEE